MKKVPWSSCGRKPCGVLRADGPDREGEPGGDQERDDGDADQPPHHGGVAVPHLVDAAQHVPDRAALRPACGRRKRTQSAGERVSALMAEITIAAEIVTANCRNSTPDRPGMKATGTKTESSTSVMAMIGAVISAIACLTACAGVQSGCSSITRSTFSTTTMASSTTMPMASTMRQQRNGVGAVADAEQDDEGADQADRHGDGRDQGGAERAEEQVHHDHDQHEGFEQGLDHLVDGVHHEGRAVVEDLDAHALGEAGGEIVQGALQRARDLHRVGAGRQVDAHGHRRLAVQPALRCPSPGRRARPAPRRAPAARSRPGWRG